MSDFQSQNPYHVYGQQPGLLGLLNTATGRNPAFPLPAPMGGAGAPAQPIPPQGMSMPVPVDSPYPPSVAGAGAGGTAGAQAAAPAPGPGGGIPTMLSQMFQRPSNSNAMIGLGLGLLSGQGRAAGFKNALEGYGRGTEQDRTDRQERETKERQEQFKLVAKTLYPEGSPLALLAQTHPDLVAQTTAQDMLQEKWSEHTLENGTKVLRSSRGDMKAIPKAEAGERYVAIGVDHQPMFPDRETGKYNGVIIGQMALSTGKVDYAPGYSASRKVQTYDDAGNLTGEVDSITNEYNPKQTPAGKAATDVGVQRAGRVMTDDEIEQKRAQTVFGTNEAIRQRIKGPYEIWQERQKAEEDARRAIDVARRGREKTPTQLGQEAAERVDQSNAQIRTAQGSKDTYDTSKVIDLPGGGKGYANMRPGGAPLSLKDADTLSPEAVKQKVEIATAGSSRAENAFNVERYKADAALIAQIQDAGRKSLGVKSTLALNKEAIQQADFKSGVGADIIGNIDSGLQTLGFKNAGKTAGLQDFFSANQSKLVKDFLGSLGNQISNADVRFAESIFGRIGQTRGALMALNDFQTRLADRAILVSQMADEYAAANAQKNIAAGKSPMAGWDKYLAEWSDKNKLYSPDEQKDLIRMIQGNQDKVDIAMQSKSTLGDPYTATNKAVVREIR